MNEHPQLEERRPYRIGTFTYFFSVTSSRSRRHRTLCGRLLQNSEPIMSTPILMPLSMVTTNRSPTCLKSLAACDSHQRVAESQSAFLQAGRYRSPQPNPGAPTVIRSPDWLSFLPHTLTPVGRTPCILLPVRSRVLPAECSFPYQSGFLFFDAMNPVLPFPLARRMV